MWADCGGRERLLQHLDSVLSAGCLVSLLNAMAVSRGNLRGRRFIKRPLLSRPFLFSVRGPK